MWIKNLCVFQSSERFTFTAQELEDTLQAVRCGKLGSQSLSTEGVVSPLKDHEALLHSDGSLILGMYQETSRLLPGAVVKELLDEKLALIEEEEGRRPGRKERADLKDQITFELMPRAFTRSRRTPFLIDLQRHRILVDAGTDARAEQVITLLRKAIGSLPVTRPNAGFSPATALTQWLREPGAMPAGFTLGDRVELKSTADDKASARFSALDLGSNEVLAHLDGGMQATKLNMVWNDEFEFDLTDTLQLKRIKPLELTQENLDNLRDDDALAELMARLSLQAGLLRDVLDRLYEHFEVETVEA